MPHLTLEYTDTLPRPVMLTALDVAHATLMESGVFEEGDIKSRLHPLAHYRRGREAPATVLFVHVRLALLAGRPPALRQRLAESLLEALKAAVPWPGQQPVELCVETCEIDRDSYAKSVISTDAG